MTKSHQNNLEFIQVAFAFLGSVGPGFVRPHCRLTSGPGIAPHLVPACNVFRAAFRLIANNEGGRVVLAFFLGFTIFTRLSTTFAKGVGKRWRFALSPDDAFRGVGRSKLLAQQAWRSG